MRRTGSMHRPDRDSPRGEHGFTVTEMITAVVIMGVILAPLTMALTQSLKLLPEAGARSESAIQETKFVERFAQDVSEITSSPLMFTTWPASPAPLRCGDAAAGLNYFLFFGTKARGTEPVRNVFYLASFLPPVAGAREMRVTRVVLGPSNVVVEPSESVLSGYCVPGEPVAYVDNTIADTGSRRYILTVLLRPEPDMPVETITAEAAVRSTNIP
jgi:prepilin-type N-terminal cleavage/methylation domain-containing protein